MTAPRATPGARWRLRIISVGLFGVILLAWEALVQVRRLPPIVLPGPGRVATELANQFSGGAIWVHLWTTLAEVALGFLLGSAVGVALGLAVAQSARAAALLRPYIVASQAMPKLALAPILVIWLGFDLTPKVVIAALISFFPLFENTVAGLRAVDPEQIELFRALRATRWQTLTRLRLPAAVPWLLAGLRVALILSLVGAVVAEFVGANRGLGALIVAAQGTLNTPLMFAVFVVLTIVGVLLSLLADLAERLVLRWRYGDDR